MSRTDVAQRGFTLLEVMVALAIFAIVALLAYRGLDSMMTTRVRLDQEMRMWRELELIFERVNVDVTQIAPRSWTDDNGKERSALQGQTAQDGSACSMDIIRFGQDHLPVHVRYTMKEHQLALDVLTDAGSIAAQQSGPVGPRHYVLLENVERCDLAFLDTTNAWRQRWPINDVADRTRPRGLRLRLTLAGRGEFERLYYLP